LEPIPARLSDGNAHQELTDMVAAGMTPAQVIVAATKTSAELIKLDQLGQSRRARAPTSSCSTPIRWININKHAGGSRGVYLRGREA